MEALHIEALHMEALHIEALCIEDFISVLDDQPIISCLYYNLISFCYCHLVHGLEIY